MDTVLIVMGAAGATLYLVSLIGGPMVLMDWLRRREQERVRRQIALTDAIYARYGPIASPVVTKPMWGPPQIQFEAGRGDLAKVLAAAQEVISVADRMELGRYRIVLTPTPDSFREEGDTRRNQSAESRSGNPRLAAG